MRMKLLLAGLAVLAGPAWLATPAYSGTTSENTLSCEEGARHPMIAGALRNNMWNRRSAGAGPWQQCLQKREANGRTEYGWRWRWPSRAGLYAYPGVVIGRSPWTAEASNDARFPRRISATAALLIDYDVEMRSSGRENLALEFWISRAAPVDGRADPTAIRAELMIWTHASPGIVADDEKPIGIVEIDSRHWRVYVKNDWGDASGGASNRWSLISYHAISPTLSVRYDARKFLQDAIDRGVVKQGDYLSGVELGNEIVSGSGSTWIRRFEVSVD